MEFYVIRVRYGVDGTTKKSEVMTYDTLRKAEAKCHSNLGTDMSDDTLSGGVCLVVASNGSIPLKEVWGEMTQPEETEVAN